MASKTGKLFLSGAITAALAAGCQTQPLRNAPSLGLDQAGRGGYEVLGAKNQCLEQPYAVFARSASDNVQMSGSRLTINGDLHTNDTLKMTGNSVVINGVGEAVDGFFIQGKGNGPATQAKGQIQPYPLTIDPAALGTPRFVFTGNVDLASRPEVWEAPGKLKPGIYKATGKLSISTNGASGVVTLIADSIQLPGKNHALSAFAGCVLAYATGSGNNTLHVTGNGGTYNGLFAAPSGQFQMTGSDNTIVGMVMADTVKIDGSVNTITFKDWGYCQPAPPSTAPTPTPAYSATSEPTASPTTAPTPEQSASTEPSSEPSDAVSPSSSPEASSSPPDEVPATPAPTPTATPAQTPAPTPTPTVLPSQTPPPTKTPPPVG